jgi:hypothetical protein
LVVGASSFTESTARVTWRVGIARLRKRHFGDENPARLKRLSEDTGPPLRKVRHAVCSLE